MNFLKYFLLMFGILMIACGFAIAAVDNPTYAAILNGLLNGFMWLFILVGLVMMLTLLATSLRFLKKRAEERD